MPIFIHGKALPIYLIADCINIYAFSFQRNDASKLEIKETLGKDHKHETIVNEIERYKSQASFKFEAPAYDQEYILCFRIKIEN